MPNIISLVLLLTPLLVPAYFANTLSVHVQQTLGIVSLLGVAGCITTNWLIPIVAKYTVNAGLFGHDINKKGTKAGQKKIPEALGIVCGIVYFTIGVIGIFWYSHDATKVEHVFTQSDVLQYTHTPHTFFDTF